MKMVIEGIDMPVHSGKDDKGCFQQWGGHGAKYYYECDSEEGRKAAKAKAYKQAAAAKSSGFKENNMKGTFARVTANYDTTLVRHDRMEDQEFLVVPMVMIVEGVLNGSKGSVLYPAEEIAKIPAIWNTKPVIVYHPKKDGSPITACDPNILSNRKIGVIMNTTFEGGKLKAEAWLNEERIKKVDKRVLDAIEKNQMMELSTGLYSDNESMEGEWKGRAYESIARNIRPDHLAILPDMTGACSIADGAGFLRVNNAAGEDVIIDESTLEDITEQYVLEHNDVISRAVDVAIENEMSLRKEKQMKKEEIVEKLIKNELTEWQDTDRENLMKMDEIVLNKMIPKDPPKPATNADAVAKAAAEGAKNIKPVVPPIVNTAETKTDKPLTLDELVTKASPELKEMISNGVATYKESKQRVIDLIVANKRCKFTKEALNAKSLDELKNLALLAIEDEPKVNQAIYDGQATVNVGAHQEEPLTIPVMEFKVA